MGGDLRVLVGHHVAVLCSCTLMLSALVSVDGMGGDIRVIYGHHVAVL